MSDIETQKTMILPLVEYLLKLTDVKDVPMFSTPRKTCYWLVYYFIKFYISNIIIYLVHLLLIFEN